MLNLDDVEKLLRKVEVLPASIPHFLHWDIAYLWMLDAQPGDLSPRWKERLRAWKRLVGLLFLDRLDFKPEGLRAKPFAEYAEQLGIKEVVRVCPKGSSDPIGVLSPTVLVRPLPDFDPERDPGRWPPDLNDDAGLRPILRHFVALAAEKLKQEEGLGERLGDILQEQFENPEKANQPLRGEYRPFRILKQIQWIPAPLDTRPVSLLISTPGKRPYVPYCNKGHLLTRRQEADAILVPEGQAEVTVRCEECNGEKSIPLSNLMIWQDSSEVIVWKDRRVLGTPFSKKEGEQVEEIYPPDKVNTQDATVVFEWGEGETDRERRFLKLKFKDRKPRLTTFNETRFHSLLVVGPRNQFKGMPIRPEWRKLVEKCPGPEWVGDSAKYRFELHGWDFGFEYHAVALQDAPNLFAGIYPDYIPGWNRYRAFVVGEDHRDYRICERSDAGSDVRRMPWCLERQGWPEYVGIVKARDHNVGATLMPERPEPSPSVQQEEVLVGVDFGTTNSLVYFALKGNVESVDEGKHAVLPYKLTEVTKGLAGDWSALTKMKEGWFLPPPSQIPQPEPDDYLIPSAYWEGDKHAIIRWTASKPFAEARPQHGFKWDRLGEDDERSRKTFLRELLLLTLPYAIRKTVGPKQLRSLRLGWAFPLAFGHGERESMKRLISDLDSYVRQELFGEESGVEVAPAASISESKANVRARGDFNPADTLLVADMGGGTLDLALFSGETLHQIGSVRFGGEDYLKSVMCSKGEDPENRYWAYRDAIADPARSSPMRGDKISSRVLGQFVCMAFEYLRTMYLALGSAVKPRIILAGNGWRLIEAVAQEETDRTGAKKVFDSFYSAKINALGYPDFSLFPDPRYPPPRRKHCVARGALKNASDQGRELDSPEETTGSMLPAGRRVTFDFAIQGEVRNIEIGWEELVGEGGKTLEQCTPEILRDGNVKIHPESAPPATSRWTLEWGLAFEEPRALLAAPEQMKEWLCANLTEMPVRIRKGPLQLLMENHWLEYLKRGE